MVPQSASQILMIRPARFGYNPETRKTNHYQHEDTRTPEEVHDTAMAEFDAVFTMYKDNNVDVHIFENTDERALCSVFPNSVSTFPGSVFGGDYEGKRCAVLHPMLEESRRRERSPALVNFFTERLGYTIVKDFSTYEDQGRALEGTGAVVMDHQNKVAYCGLSHRADLSVAREYAEFIGYELFSFETSDHNHNPVYHTDVLMHIGTGYACLCVDIIVDEDRARIRAALGRHHDVIELSTAQLRSFCGNALEVQNRDGEKLLAMSSRAYGAFESQQKAQIESHGVRIIHAAIPVIEDNGGGSVRCMTQELFD